MAQDTVDYDKQFQEDLERAQALSLESLALEQFKNQKRLQELALVDDHVTQKISKPVVRASSMTETDSNRSDRLVVKSRPRPGAIATSQGQPLLAPPPSITRRNSSVSNPAEPSTDDLISFTSPSSSNKLLDMCQQLYSYNSPISTTSVSSHNVQRSYQYPNYTQPQSQQQFVPQIGWNPSLAFGGANGNSGTNYLSQPAKNLYNNSPNTVVSHMRLDCVPSSYNNQAQLQPPLIYPTRTTPVPNSTISKENTPVPPHLTRPTKSQSVSSHDGPSVSSSTPKTFGHQRKPSSNLIDLTLPSDDSNSVRVSILEAFDPFIASSTTDYESVRAFSPDYSVDDSASVHSVYDEYDPYDIIHSGSGNNSVSDPIYAAVVRSENVPISPPPPLPPRMRDSTMNREKSYSANRSSRLPDSIKTTDKQNPNDKSDLKAFYEMVQSLRNEFKHDTPNTNMGLVVSPMIDYQYRDSTSIRLKVYPRFEGADPTKPCLFTCDVTSSVQHVTMQLTVNLDAPSTDQYTLKVWKCNEYLVPSTLLSQYEYVHNCIKLEEDVVLLLIPDRDIDKSLRRTVQDDNCDRTIDIQQVIPNEPNPPISCDNLKLLLETFEKEIDKLIATALKYDEGSDLFHMPDLNPQSVMQTVKLIVNLLGSVETLELTESLNIFKEFFSSNNLNDYSSLWKNRRLSDVIEANCEKVRESLKGLIQMYSRAFRVNFSVRDYEESSVPIDVGKVSDSVSIKICAIFRPSDDWTYDNYIVASQIYHGMRPVGAPVLTQPYEIQNSMYPRIPFNNELDMSLPISSLARESRLVVVIYGRTLAQVQEDSNKEPLPQYNQEEIGWTAIQFFDYNNFMVSGQFLLSIWPKESSHIYGPAPSPGTYPFDDQPVIGIQINGPPKVKFPAVTLQTTRNDFNSLDYQTQQQLSYIFEQDMFYKCPNDLREILWDKRHYLYNIPDALPKVLLASNSWEWTRLGDLHGMLNCWSPMRPIDAIQLLLPSFPDMEVRKLAVKWLNPMPCDQLVDYLPQLVVALRHETYEDSALARFLLSRALTSARVAHHLFWLLSHNLPGNSPQNYGLQVTDRDVYFISEVRHHRRLLLLLRALLATCGSALRNCFISQQMLVEVLHTAALDIQKSKESARHGVLAQRMHELNEFLHHSSTRLPLSPTLQVVDIDVGSCSYYNSNALPLKINFIGKDHSVIPTIFKVGDELQQDMLTLQMVRLMDKLWLKEGLDLKMVTYGCVATGAKQGMIEMVIESETLREIQVEYGVMGSFKDKPIAEWLAKHNPSELEYSRAVENFTASCAGYCVVTYILGICDRHNDNIMLKKSGHLFHIDFGKFLGDAQMFGNFKRDRSPFVLTSDMAYVINGGDRPSEKFHKFVDLCCQAFNIVRANGNLFLYLFFLMTSAGMKGVTNEAVCNLHKGLLPELSNPEAAAYFARLIQKSLRTWFTQVNFFLHNLAQHKFAADQQGDGETLSFIPNTYSKETDGKLTHVQVVGFRKFYDPDKHYVYVLRVTRADETDPMEILRTYKEFAELHQKLCLRFPLAKLFSLSNGMHLGRSKQQMAGKRISEISNFMKSLFETADEIAHSELVYTFFHPILRDQKVPDQLSKKSKEERKLELKKEIGKLKGQLKLTIHYNRKVFTVMVHHVRGLPLMGNAQEPSTYVKLYLLPDQKKETKRKTKVVKKNRHPSFMEMLEYRMPLETIQNRRLTATVWNYDPLQENEFLGGVVLELSQFDLTQEISEWFPLNYI